MKSIAATSRKFATRVGLKRIRQGRGLRYPEWMVVHAVNHADDKRAITNIALKIKGADPQHPLGAFQAGLLTGILMVPTGYNLRQRRQPKARGKNHAQNQYA